MVKKVTVRNTRLMMQDGGKKLERGGKEGRWSV